MKKLIVVLILFSLNGLLLPQQIELPKVIENDLPGIKITREQTFDGGGLWGYINGGADIFLEYGFDLLQLQEIEFDNTKVKAEIYKMNDPKSAFGIYSVSQYKCSEGIANIKFSCVTEYQIQAVISQYYISIINSNGSENEKDLSKKLFSIISAKIEGKELSIPKLFLQEKLVKSINTLKYFKGPLGLQNGLQEWYDYFDGLLNYELFAIQPEIGSSPIRIANIKFSSADDLLAFLKKVDFTIVTTGNLIKASSNGFSRIVKTISNDEIIFIEGNVSSDELDSFVEGIF